MEGRWTHVDDVQRLFDRRLRVKGEAGVDLGGDLARDDFEDLLAKLDQEAVQGVVDLGVDGAALGLCVFNGHVHQLGVLGLLGSSEDEGRVGGCILGLVFANRCRQQPV